MDLLIGDPWGEVPGILARLPRVPPRTPRQGTRTTPGTPHKDLSREILGGGPGRSTPDCPCPEGPKTPKTPNFGVRDPRDRGGPQGRPRKSPKKKGLFASINISKNPKMRGGRFNQPLIRGGGADPVRDRGAPRGCGFYRSLYFCLF